VNSKTIKPAESGALLPLLLVALNLRPALASLGPVLESVRSSLHLSYGAAGLLTSLPVICMGVFAPATLTLSQRFGVRITILGTTLLIGVATLLRIHASLIAQLTSTLLIGMGVAVLGPLLNMYIKQAFPQRSARVSSWVTTALCLGAALAAGSTATLSNYLGWPCALGSWALLAFIAAGYWLRSNSGTSHAAHAGKRSPLPWRQARAWQLMVMFGLNSLVFYALLAWLAPAYISLGVSAARAGQLLGVFALLQIAGTLLVSLLPPQQRERRPALLVGATCTLGGLLGVGLIPLSAPLLWMALLGAGTAGLFALALILPLDYSDSAESAGSWTAMMSGGGYIIAALGPYVCGVLRDITGSYRSVFAALCVVSTCGMLLCLLLRPNQSRSVLTHAL
jgi:MFS transporter, CP family, cyanate transporter